MDLLFRKLTRQLNTLDEKSAFIKTVPEADRMLKMLSDFGEVLI